MTFLCKEGLVIVSIGSKIKNLRHEKGITQKELCGSYINRVVLGRIENDKMLPSLEQLNYIAKRLDVNVSYFMLEVNNIDIGYTEHSLKRNTELSEMYIKGDYYKIIKSTNDICRAYGSDDFNEKFYIGMSYYNLNIFYEAIKPLKKYVNKYLTSPKDIQEKYIINFIIVLNTLFKIMLKNKNFIKCESYLKIAIKYIHFYNADNSYVSFSIYNNLAFLYLKQCKFNEIVKLLEPFVITHKAIIYPYVLASIYLSLNIAYYNLNEYQNSIEAIKKAINLYQICDDDIQVGKCYFNYINVLRYSLKCEEALEVLNKCLQDYSSYTDLYNKFLLQEMVIYFNMQNYLKIKDIARHIDPNKLDKANKCDFNLIIGHIEHVYNKNDRRAYEYLIKVLEYYKKNNYNKDLYTILCDLYEITGNKHYRDEASECMGSIYKRKNVLT